MQKPKLDKGSVTISREQMSNCTTLEHMLYLFRQKGVPLMDHPGIFEPHPDYIYTECVDYKYHHITITWELKS